MWWAQAIGAAMSLFGAVKQFGAASDAKRIGAANAAASIAETKETLRRMGKEHGYKEGITRTTAAASGFAITKDSSQQGYIDEMIKEHKLQRSFTQEAGTRNTRILFAGGQLAYEQGKASAIGSFADSISLFGQAYASSPWGTK